ARERSASSSRAHGPAPGSRATPRRALRPAAVAGPAQPSAGCSIVRGARLRSVDWTAPTVSPASSVSFPCPASLVTVILANSVSQETGSDLDLSQRVLLKVATLHEPRAEPIQLDQPATARRPAPGSHHHVMLVVANCLGRERGHRVLPRQPKPPVRAQRLLELLEITPIRHDRLPRQLLFDLAMQQELLVQAG